MWTIRFNGLGVAYAQQLRIGVILIHVKKWSLSGLNTKVDKEGAIKVKSASFTSLTSLIQERPST